MVPLHPLGGGSATLQEEEEEEEKGCGFPPDQHAAQGSAPSCRQPLRSARLLAMARAAPRGAHKMAAGGTGAEGGRHGRAGARGGRALLSCGPVRGVSVLLTTWCCAEKFPELGFVRS